MLKTFTDAEFKELLEKHWKWLRGEAGGEQADLSSADLRSANLRSADLRWADLRSADLRSANLRSADLRSADLSSADLRSANLSSANLHSAKLDEPIQYSDIYYLLKMQKKSKLRAWKYLVDGKSPYQHATYAVGETYTFVDLYTDANEQCGKGGNVATLNWCLKDNLQADEFIEVEFNTSAIVVPYFTDGKFRVREFKVLRQVNRKEAIELIKGLEVANGNR